MVHIQKKTQDNLPVSELKTSSTIRNNNLHVMAS
jgi:hypothetical protein